MAQPGWDNARSNSQRVESREYIPLLAKKPEMIELTEL
jgi:hypothetical protein